MKKLLLYALGLIIFFIIALLTKLTGTHHDVYVLWIGIIVCFLFADFIDRNFQ